MRRLAAVALVLVGIAGQARAQRATVHGPTGGAGAGRGLSVQSASTRTAPSSVAPAFHGGAPVMQGRPSFGRAYPPGQGAFRGGRPMVAVPRNGGSRPEFFRRPPARPVRPPRRPNGPWNGWAYPVGVGWIAPGYAYYDGAAGYADEVSADFAGDPGEDGEDGAQMYADPAAGDGAPAQPDVDPGQQDQPDAYGTYPPLATDPTDPTDQPRPAAGPAREKPVTLVFKDGRPNEQVRNFILTRTTLFVTGENQREIPVVEIDLAATKKANRGSGVAFDLPVATP